MGTADAHIRLATLPQYSLTSISLDSIREFMEGKSWEDTDDLRVRVFPLVDGRLVLNTPYECTNTEWVAKKYFHPTTVVQPRHPECTRRHFRQRRLAEAE